MPDQPNDTNVGLVERKAKPLAHPAGGEEACPGTEGSCGDAQREQGAWEAGSLPGGPDGQLPHLF